MFKFRVKHNFQLDSDKPVFEIAIRQAIIDIDINMNFYNMHPLHDDNRILYNRIDYYERIDVTKSKNSIGRIVCHYWHSDNEFRFQM